MALVGRGLSNRFLSTANIVNGQEPPGMIRRAERAGLLVATAALVTIPSAQMASVASTSERVQETRAAGRAASSPMTTPVAGCIVATPVGSAPPLLAGSCEDSQGAPPSGARSAPDVAPERRGPWSEVQRTTPAPRFNHSMVYDSARSQLVLFGGCCKPTSTFNDTWTSKAGVWTERRASQPGPGQQNAGAAYDEARRETVVFAS